MPWRAFLSGGLLSSTRESSSDELAQDLFPTLGLLRTPPHLSEKTEAIHRRRHSARLPTRQKALRVDLSEIDRLAQADSDRGWRQPVMPEKLEGAAPGKNQAAAKPLDGPSIATLRQVPDAWFADTQVHPMSGIPLDKAADLIAAELAAVLGTDTAWITPRWVRQVLEQPTKCCDCSRPIWAARSVAAGRGPRCAAKRVRRPTAAEQQPQAGALAFKVLIPNSLATTLITEWSIAAQEHPQQSTAEISPG